MMTIAFAESFMLKHRKLTPHKLCCSLSEKIAGNYFTVVSLTLQRRTVLGQYSDAAITTHVNRYQLQHSTACNSNSPSLKEIHLSKQISPAIIFQTLHLSAQQGPKFLSSITIGH
jgi:hypothetical protein